MVTVSFICGGNQSIVDLPQVTDKLMMAVLLIYTVQSGKSFGNIIFFKR
jgi:hypothetical protein